MANFENITIEKGMYQTNQLVQIATFHAKRFLSIHIKLVPGSHLLIAVKSFKHICAFLQLYRNWPVLKQVLTLNIIARKDPQRIFIFIFIGSLIHRLRFGTGGESRLRIQFERDRPRPFRHRHSTQLLLLARDQRQASTQQAGHPPTRKLHLSHINTLNTIHTY